MLVINGTEKAWINGFGNSDRVQEYVSEKRQHMNEKYVDGAVDGMGRMIVMRLFTCEGNYKDDDLRCVCVLWCGVRIIFIV